MDIKKESVRELLEDGISYRECSPLLIALLLFNLAFNL